MASFLLAMQEEHAAEVPGPTTTAGASKSEAAKAAKAAETSDTATSVSAASDGGGNARGDAPPPAAAPPSSSPAPTRLQEQIDRAAAYREIGNDKFNAKEYIAAVEYYTFALASISEARGSLPDLLRAEGEAVAQLDSQ